MAVTFLILVVKIPDGNNLRGWRWCWKDGSAIKSTCCSFRIIRDCFQNHLLLQFQESQCPSGLYRHQACIWYTDKHQAITKIKINKSFLTVQRKVCLS